DPHSHRTFSDNFAAMELKKKNIIYDKPIYVGFAILELSKEIMYSFYYDYMKPKFVNNVEICYQDTDSFILAIHDKDFHEKIKADIPERFDTSNLKPENNKFGFPILNHRVLGMMKDETGWIPIHKFVGLKSKMYAIKIADN
uniref:DNA-directed DNA polymerase n=1 Tax=Megaselia scalaris TaxID=36166 RepID=T1H6H0_MEGSC